VFPRSARHIELSPQVRAALDIEETSLTPEELMHRILLAPVDLFYNGGIGTYIKASTETHAQVKDRANDNIRVSGNELRCKVVAEGGNLGATQAGRIEFAWPAAASSPMRSTTRPAWTAPTTKSTSRSGWTPKSTPASCRKQTVTAC
jgi:hypothetical protein